MSEQVSTAGQHQLPQGYNQQEADNRAKAWAKMGTGIYVTELQLQASAQAAILSIKKPTTFAEVEEAELKLKELRATETAISKRRMEITSRFDAKKTELMKSENSIAPHYKELEAAVIALKKVERERKEKETKKTDEINFFRQHIASQLAEVLAGFERKILDAVSVGFSHALKTKVTPEKIGEYVSRLAERITPMDFIATYIPPRAPQYINDDEFGALKTELWVIECAAFCEKFRRDLKTKFEFYDIEFNNASEALLKAEKETAEAELLIESNKSNAQVAAQLEGTAMVLSTSPSVKELKSAYKLQMDETEANQMQIMKAYLANITICRPKVRITKAFNLAVTNMITALEKVKNEDNKFAPQGITFVEVDKL